MYTVTVTREDDSWVGEVAGLPGAHTWAKNLPALRANLVEVIRLVDDIPDADDDPAIALEFEGVSETFARAAELGEKRRQLDESARALQVETQEVVRGLAAEGWSVRDIGAALSLTPGRVSQLTQAA